MILYLREGKLLEAKTMYDKTDKTLGTFVSYILFNCTKTTKINYVLRIIALENSWILGGETTHIQVLCCTLSIVATCDRSARKISINFQKVIGII